MINLIHSMSPCLCKILDSSLVLLGEDMGSRSDSSEQVWWRGLRCQWASIVQPHTGIEALSQWEVAGFPSAVQMWCGAVTNDTSQWDPSEGAGAGIVSWSSLIYHQTTGSPPPSHTPIVHCTLWLFGVSAGTQGILSALTHVKNLPYPPRIQL